LKEVGKGTFGSVIKAIDTRMVQPKLIIKLLQANSMQRDITNPYQDPSNFVAIKKLFYDRRYEQRELSTLNEIKSKGLCSNIIEVKDQYFRNEPADEAERRKGVLTKEYLFIVTDFQPFTISDLRVIPSTYMTDSSFDQSPTSVRNYCLESIK
jgi:serine/threonine protein kinase